MLRITHFLDNWLTDSGKVVILMCWPLFTPQKDFLVLSYFRGWVRPKTIVQLEGLGKLKKFNDLIGTQTRDLPA
jgi:hypothetical protein